MSLSRQEIDAALKNAMEHPHSNPYLLKHSITGHLPIPVVDTFGMDNTVWVEGARKHGYPSDDPRWIEHTIGGSDVAKVYGFNPWETLLEFWKTKKGIWTPPPKDNAKQLEMGHLLEPIAAYWFAEITGNQVIEDTWMYQSSEKPWALADFDRRYIRKSDGKEGILECKSTTYHNADHWANGRFPAYYETQLRFYMWVADVDIGSFVCIWGSNPDTDIAIVEIERDYDWERDMIERIQDFMDSLEGNIPPSILIDSPSNAAEGLKRLYPKSDKSLPEVEFPKDFANLCSIYMDCSEQIKALEERKTSIAIQLQEAMKEAQTGFVDIDESTIYSITWKSQERVSFDMDAFKKKYPKLYSKFFERFNKTVVTRPFKVSMKKKKK